MQNLRYYCRYRNKVLTDKPCKFACALIKHIIVQSANKTSYNWLSNLKSYWNKRVSCQRTIIHVFLQHEENVWIQ